VALTSDLEPLAEHAEADATALARREAAKAALATRPNSRWVVAVMSGAERRGQWRLPRRLRAVAIMGGIELDFRDAVFPAGVTEVSVLCLMGGCEVIVPPGVHVECGGIGIMGGFDTVDRMPPTTDPDEPVLRIKGLAMMGGLHLETRLPGESRRQAKKRRKREARALDGGNAKALPPGDD
jgi:hypothetical protein